jgi:hypothetical protein
MNLYLHEFHNGLQTHDHFNILKMMAGSDIQNTCNQLELMYMT